MALRPIRQKAKWELYELIISTLAHGWSGLDEKHPIEADAIRKELAKMAYKFHSESHIPALSGWDHRTEEEL